MDKNPTPHSNPENKLHFLDYWRIIRIRKTVILAVFFLVFLTTAAVTVILPKTYSSTARIRVDKDTTDVSPLFERQASTPYDPYFMQTEFEVIQSKNVLYKVIEELGLNEKWAKRYDIPGGLKTQETFQILLGQIDVNQFRNTSIIEIQAFSREEEEAALIANKIAETYKQNRLGQRREWSMNGIRALQEELDSQTKKVKEQQEEVDRLREKYNITDVSSEGSTATMLEPWTVRQLNVQLVEANTAVEESEAHLEKLQKLGQEDKELLKQALPSATSDQILQELLSREIQAEQELTSLSHDRADEHPDVKRVMRLLATVRSQIDERINGILNGLEARLTIAKANAQSLSNAVQKAKEHDVQATSEAREYFLAKRELENAQRIRDALMVRVLQETVDANLPKSSTVVVLDQAEPALKAARPNMALNLTLGVIVGLVVGIGLAFFIEYLDTSVKTIDDVERALQAPVLGVIPQNVGSLLDEGPESPHAEAYRVLRTNLMFSRKKEKANTLTVVSGGAGEGKSTTVFNLATVFAQSGQRVLVVDSDLRRPSLHKILNVSNSVGLTNFLLQQNGLEEVIQTTSIPTLDFLPSGKLPSSSMGILNSNRMREFIQETKKRYEYVFFDSPPIMGVSDASILASEVDMALLVVQYRKYPQAMTLRAKQMVEKVGGNLLGVVLNNINISQDSYYYYYSGYYYDYYSKKEDDDQKTVSRNGSKEKDQEKETSRIDLNQKY